MTSSRLRTWNAAVLATVLVFVLAACGGGGGGEETGDSGSASGTEAATDPEGGASGEPIKVGVLIQLSGAAGVFGPPSQQAAELAEREINDAGGVLGRPIEIVIGDDATDANVAQEQAERLLNRENVDVLISTESSAAREAVLPIAQRAGKPMIYTPLYEGGACADSLYNLGEVPVQQVEPVIPYIQETYGGDSWYIVGDDYNWPRALGEVANDVVEGAGGSIAGEEYVPLGTSDFGTVINNIESSEADLVMMTLVGADAIAFVQQLNEFGLGQDVRIFGLAMLDNTLPALGGDIEPVIASFGYFETLDNPENEAFLSALDEMFGEDRAQQTTLSEGTYEGIHLYAQAVEEAGSTETDAVVEALNGQQFDAPRGPITIGDSRHVTQRMYIGESRDDGTYEVIHDLGEIEPGDQC